jgi:hypothetical protein
MIGTAVLRNRSLSLWALIVIQCAHGSAGLQSGKGPLVPRQPPPRDGLAAHCRWNRLDATARRGTQSVRRSHRDCQETRSRCAVFGVPVREGNRARQHSRLNDFLHVRRFSGKPPKASKDVRDQTGHGPLPHESGCTASLRIWSFSGARKRAKPICRRSSTKTEEVSSRCSHCSKTRADSFDPMRGTFCQFRPRFPGVVSGIFIPLSRRSSRLRVVRPREVQEL